MRKIIHFILAMAGFILWGTANIIYSTCAGLAVIGSNLNPKSEWGNCWSHVLPLWWKHGGYLIVRRAYGNMFLGCLPLPHVLWAKKLNLDRNDVEHFSPVERKRTKWFPWYAVYFRGRVVNGDVAQKVYSNA
jgi:hypothetical protein